MKIPFYQVDAFTNKRFGGNPAAICILDKWLSPEQMLNIAAENNLSETAYLLAEAPGCYQLKWFTPAVEMDLCGHATLASAYVLFRDYDQDQSLLKFQTLSGELQVHKESDLLCMSFPARAPTPCTMPDILAEALGAEPDQVLAARDLMAVFDDESIVAKLQPDMQKLKSITDYFAVIVTAPGRDCDFVSRFFAPNAGVDEDPATGSAHCSLIPYWAQRLNKTRLHALQLSKRVGEFFCEDCGDRVKISGHASLYAQGHIYLD